MKLPIRLLVLILFFIPLTIAAQTPEATVNNINWSLIPSMQWEVQIMAQTTPGSIYSEGMASGFLKLDDNSIISRIQIDKNNYGLVRLNKDMSIQWLQPFDDNIRYTGIFHGKLLLVSTDENGDNEVYNGIVIDPKNGQILFRKELINLSDGMQHNVIPLFAPDGSAFKLAVRTSTAARKQGFFFNLIRNKDAELYFGTTDFKVLDFNDQLQLKNTFKPVLEKGNFIGATIDNNGSIFLLTIQNQAEAVLAKYTSEVTPVKVLQLHVNLNNHLIDLEAQKYLLESSSNHDIFYFVTMFSNPAHERELTTGKFNFKDGTVINNTQIMDKDYMKALKKTFIPFNKKFDDVDFGFISELEVEDVIENNGKLIVCISGASEQSNGLDNTVLLVARDLLVNIYDEKNYMQAQQIIPRKYGSLRMQIFRGAGLHCRNNMLYIIANNDKGLNGTKALFGQIDLKTGSVVDLGYIDKSEIKNKYIIDPEATIWYADKFIVNYMQIKGWSAGSMDAHLQLVAY